jgi:hypothetical protein
MESTRLRTLSSPCQWLRVNPSGFRLSELLQHFIVMADTVSPCSRENMPQMS